MEEARIVPQQPSASSGVGGPTGDGAPVATAATGGPAATGATGARECLVKGLIGLHRSHTN